MAEPGRALLGVVLAGGRSRRMGRDKALLTWGPRTWLEHAAWNLEQIPCDVVWVSGDRAHYFCVPDEWPSGLGPLGGIRTVLRCLLKVRGPLHQARVLFLPVDMPLLEPALIRALAEADFGPEVEAVTFEGHELPLLVRNASRVLEEADALVASGTDSRFHSIRKLLSALEVRRMPVPVEESWKLMNLNEPSDIEELRSLG